jgi:two-component system response regulator YesN
LSRLFKTDLGLSAGDVLRLLRIAHAKKLLNAGQYSITEVALESGYSAMSQFISNFKAATGTLPSQYRKK